MLKFVDEFTANSLLYTQILNWTRLDEPEGEYSTSSIPDPQK